MVKYQTAEQIVWDKAKPSIKDVLHTASYFCKGTYDAVASSFRIPTFIRRMVQAQDHLSRNKSKLNGKKERMVNSFSYALGLFAGWTIDVAFLDKSTEIAKDGNSLPIGIFIATNVASGIYEAGRFIATRKSKIEAKVSE